MPCRAIVRNMRIAYSIGGLFMGAKVTLMNSSPSLSISTFSPPAVWNKKQKQHIYLQVDDILERPHRADPLVVHTNHFPSTRTIPMRYIPPPFPLELQRMRPDSR